MLNKTEKRIAIGSILIVATIGYLIYSAVQSGANYYQTVCEAKQLSSDSSRRLRLEGKVVAKSLQRDSRSLNLTFRLRENKKETVAICDDEITVRYQGVTPDLMQEDITVIVEGKFTDSGQFEADKLLTSCPSRYDAAAELSTKIGDK